MASGKFDHFVVFAEMRTGSNFLESNLNAFGAFECHGEAFNPGFIGSLNGADLLGVTLEERDADPLQLLTAIRTKSSGMGGFRYFHDHDPRILETVIRDPHCAKIILTRNLAESYVSWKIAQATRQWKLTDIKRRREDVIAFEAAEFHRHIARQQAFQLYLLNQLQVSGQTAFYIAYEDLQNLDVINGLARYLGTDERLEKLDESLKRQNPKPIRDKVSNFDEMEAALSAVDFFDLSRTPNFEPRRGAGVPSFVTAAKAPLLYMPVRSGPEAEICAWLADLDQVPVSDLPTQLTQKTLRQWKRHHPGHRSFTVLRHPVARAYAVFCTRILAPGPEGYRDIRRILRHRYKLPLPETLDHSYDLATHKAAFSAFLEFLELNLAGQSGIRIDPHWGTQSAAIQNMSAFCLPDWIIREDEMPAFLDALAYQVGYTDPPGVPVQTETEPTETEPYALAAIYDAEIEARISRIYQRDYMMFGFGPWQGGA